MDDSEKKIEYPDITGFSADEVIVITQLCLTHFSIPKIAEALGIDIENITNNVMMMDYIRETRQKDEIQFWETIKAMALGGDKDAMIAFTARMNSAKLDDYE